MHYVIGSTLSFIPFSSNASPFNHSAYTLLHLHHCYVHHLLLGQDIFTKHPKTNTPKRLPARTYHQRALTRRRLLATRVFRTAQHLKKRHWSIIDWVSDMVVSEWRRGKRYSTKELWRVGLGKAWMWGMYDTFWWTRQLSPTVTPQHPPKINFVLAVVFHPNFSSLSFSTSFIQTPQNSSKLRLRLSVGRMWGRPLPFWLVKGPLYAP